MAGTRRPVHPRDGEHSNTYTDQEDIVPIVEPGTVTSESTRRNTRSRAAGGGGRV